MTISQRIYDNSSASCDNCDLAWELFECGNRSISRQTFRSTFPIYFRVSSLFFICSTRKRRISKQKPKRRPRIQNELSLSGEPRKIRDDYTFVRCSSHGRKRFVNISDTASLAARCTLFRPRTGNFQPYESLLPSGTTRTLNTADIADLFLIDTPSMRGKKYPNARISQKIIKTIQHRFRT